MDEERALVGEPDVVIRSERDARDEGAALPKEVHLLADASERRKAALRASIKEVGEPEQSVGAGRERLGRLVRAARQEDRLQREVVYHGLSLGRDLAEVLVGLRVRPGEPNVARLVDAYRRI